MANDRKSGWQEFREGFKWMGQNVVTWISNLIAWKPYSENNTNARALLFWWEDTTQSQPTRADSISINKPTLNDVASWATNVTSVPDISTPQNLLWNSTSWLGDISEDRTVLDNVVPKDILWASNILQNTSLKESEKVMQAEEDAKNESWWKTVWNFFKSIRDSISDWNVSNILDTKRQADEKIVALWYNEDNWNILRLSFNEGQWLSDDFGDTFFKRWQENESIFNTLYSEYQDELADIVNGNYTNEEKYQMARAAYDKFLNEVNERKLLKVYEDDFYSDWLVYWWADKNTKVLWRRRDQFTKDQLDNLAKSSIKEAWIYEITPAQLDAFLEMYEANNESAQRYSLTDSTDTAKVRYELEDEWLATLKSTETHQIVDPAMAQIRALVDSGAVTPQVWNEILQRTYQVAENALNQMHLYLDEPLAYYKAVQNKDYWDLTTWEKAILGYGDGIMQFMDDYTKALQRWVSQTISWWIENWELVNVAETIDWLSITDFFKDAISDANIKAWWLDLLATESAIDAMQHINNNINYLYRQWKGNPLRRWWTEAQRIWWTYWYAFWELYQLWTYGWVKWIEALMWKENQSLADYDLADFTTGRMMTTDEGDFDRLLKQYWLAALENLPEFLWELEAIRPFLWWTSKYARLSSKIAELDKTARATRKLNTFSKIFNTAKQSVGDVQKAWGAKNWISKMYWAVSDGLSPKARAIMELWSNGIKRVVRDQAIDAIASYYDTESYSTPSFLLSVWLTWITELLPSILWDTQLYKMIKNKIKWLDWTSWTWWRLMDVINSDDELLRRRSNIFWTDFNTFKTIASWGWWDEVENLLKVSYNMLSPDWKMAINNFWKQQMLEQLRRIWTIDWQSTYWRNLMALINAEWSNISDIWKYILWAPWEVNVWWFTSSILFKEWAERQTRYLKQAYDVELDKISWQFRRGLENWFTKEQIEELASRTKYTDVIENGKVNSKYFEKDGDRYILNSDWANYLKLDVTDYTDAMRKADAIRAQAEGTKEFLDETIGEIAASKWISPDVISRMATSWAYQKMVDEFSRLVC